MPRVREGQKMDLLAQFQDLPTVSLATLALVAAYFLYQSAAYAGLGARLQFVLT